MFLLRGSAEKQGGWKSLGTPSHLFLAAIAVGAFGSVLLAYNRRGLIPLGVAAAGLHALQILLVRGHARNGQEKRSLSAEIVGTTLLSLAAPAAWVAARGRWEALALEIWLLNLAFFLGGVLYVKYRVRGLLAHEDFAELERRAAFAWPVLVYHLLLVAFLAAAAILDSLSGMVVVAFVPGALRALALLFQLGRRFAIRRLGWSEIAHAVLFAVLLLMALR